MRLNIDGFEKGLDSISAETKFSGVVRFDGPTGLEFAKAYGLADRAHQIPVTTDTQFGTASVTKGFTALAVVGLIADGTLKLSTTARSVLGSDLPLIDDTVTVEQLLLHRSGIGDYLDEGLDLDFNDYLMPIPVHQLVTPEDYLAVLDGFPTSFPPGEKFAYCNGGYVVLALIAERASGVAYADLVAQRVCEPAGLTDTAFLRSDELPGTAALGYLFADEPRTNLLHLPVRGVGDGGIYSTVSDFARLWRAFFDGQIVPQDWVETMTTLTSEVPEESLNFGLGIWLHPGKNSFEACTATTLASPAAACMTRSRPPPAPWCRTSPGELGQLKTSSRSDPSPEVRRCARVSTMTKFARVKGSAYERGAGIGEAFAEATARSVAFNRRYLATHGLDTPALTELLMPYLDAATAAMPDLVQQLHGMADGAEQPFVDIFFANAFEEVYGVVELDTPFPVPLERCTDVVLRAEGSTLLGHNEQWYAGDDGSVGLVLDVSDDGPAVLAPMVAGTLPLVGINEYGSAFGTMSLSATDERVGIPRALVARGILDARDRADAFALANRDGRAGGYSFLCAFPGGDACVIESTATTATLLDIDVHTNHALDPTVAEAACDPSAGSRSRLARARDLATSTEPTVEGMADLLSDHEAAGMDICVHPDPSEGDEGSTILFAMICESETRSMWLAAGHPCTASFERVGSGTDEIAL